MPIAIGSAHRGSDVNRRISTVLQQLGHEVVDVGPEGSKSMDYPTLAFQPKQFGTKIKL
jgi:ribose 5-phosphate isomerase RpiB